MGNKTYNAADIAKLILKYAEDAGEPINHLKLQKLLYYEQGYHLAYFGKPLFEDDIEAWQFGPVVPNVFEVYKERENFDIIRGEDINFCLEGEEASLFNEVFGMYNKYSALGLIEMTHSETPWKNTPVGVGNVISKDLMRKFFETKIE